MTTSTEQIIIKNTTWWKRRSTYERALTIMIIGTVLLTIGLIVGIEVVATSIRACDTQLTDDIKSKELVQIGNDVICTTPGCVHAASEILYNMDPDVDPCDNFYEFACGSFVKDTVVPDDQPSVDTFSIIDDELQMQLKMAIEEDTMPSDSRAFILIKMLYENCMNKNLIEDQGVKPLNDILAKLGGWPILESEWDPESFDWMEATYKYRKIGYSTDYFITFDIDIHPKNSSKSLITLDQTWLPLPREYLIKGLQSENVKSYYNYMVDIAVMLGADRRRATIELLDSLIFEIGLANISMPSELRRNASELYNPMTVGELKQQYPEIQWSEYLNKLLEPYTAVDDNEIINVREPKFLSKFIDLLNTTPKRTQGNYAVWRVVRDSIAYLNDDLRKRQLAYWTEVNGEREREPRWQECVGVVSNGLALSVGALYIRKYFDDEAKKNVVEMITDLRREFRKIIEKVDWMDEETRVEALAKIDAMNSFIAYPSELLDDNKLEDFYKLLEITPGNYIESIMNLTIFSTEYQIQQLRLPVNKSDWVNYGESAVVNAYYSPNVNSMQFPAGILQGEFFNKDRPQYMNYGAIGFVMGHELTHGFDDQGSQYDKEGNLVEWWNVETKEKFLQKAKCIIEQYENYTDAETGLNLNGINTQGENIADNGGIKEAYLAYNEWVRRNGPEPLLPGLNYTPQQMFWISAANVWCIKQRVEAKKIDIITDEHSPGEFRVIGPLSNMPEFAKDFKCPLGSKMNPVHKCSVW